MKKSEPGHSADEVADLTARLAAAEQALEERDQTIRELKYREEERERAIAAILGGPDENALLHSELQWKTAFLEAQANASLDGLLVVNEKDKMILQNPRFIELLKIPKHIVDEIDDANRLKWVTEMVKDPERFVARVKYLYAHPDEVSRDEIELIDGTVLDRYSSPVVGPDGTYYGRIWSFRDITERKRAEEEMRVSEERFTGAFEHAPIGVALVAPDGHWLKVNRALCALLGYSEAELLSRTFQQITYLEDLKSDLESVQRLLDGEARSYQKEKHYIHKQGHLVTALLNVSLVRDGHGVPLYFVSLIQDITERKRAEEAIRESEERFAGAFEYAPIGVALVAIDGHWLKVNHALCELIGYSEEELLERTFQEVTYAADLETDLDLMRQTVEGKIRTYQMEKRYIHKLGHLVTVLLNVSLVRDGQGQPRYFISQIQDITERKLAEEALRESKRFAESIAENSTSLIYIFDLETGDTVYSNRNAAASLGYTPEQARKFGNNVLALVHPEDLPKVWQHLSDFEKVDDDRILDIEYRVKNAQGKWQWNWARDTVFNRRPDGTAWQIMGTVQDITEHKQAVAELEMAHKQIVETSRLAGMAEVATSVLHNVGNVLNSVNISAGIVLEGVKRSRASNLAKVAALLRDQEGDMASFFTTDPKGKQVPAYLAQLSEHLLAEQKTAVDEMNLLLKNIDHIKVIVTMQQGYAKVSGNREVVNLRDLVEDGLSINSEALVRRGIEVTREYDELIPPLNIDRHKVMQVLVNLIRNAIHACQASGRADKRMEVRVSKTSHSVCISVTDNGVGIPEENLTRIFSHGFTTSKEGHGFGLHSGALAAKEMGGSLTVQSPGPGQGATFTLELPTAKG